MIENMSDSNLLAKTEALVREEREILTTLLLHFKEIERRRLFSSFGFSSLFVMAVKHFGYSADQAFRRISAMRLLKELPEVEKKINSGELTLTHINLAQSLFRSEKKIHSKDMSYSKKLSVLNQIANKPIREAEKIAISLSSDPASRKPDRVHTLTEQCIELKFVASVELRGKLEKLKGLLAHKNANISLGELFEKLCDLGIDEWNKANTRKEKNARKLVLVNDLFEEKAEAPPDKIEVSSNNRGTAPLGRAEECDQLKNRVQAALGSTAAIARREGMHEIGVRGTNENGKDANTTFHDTAVPAAIKVPGPSKAKIKRDVFKKSGGCCTTCRSTYMLEIDHIIPKALGGIDDPQHLRVLCRSCNQRSAILHLGQRKMDRHLNRDQRKYPAQ